MQIQLTAAEMTIEKKLMMMTRDTATKAADVIQIVNKTEEVVCIRLLLPFLFESASEHCMKNALYKLVHYITLQVVCFILKCSYLFSPIKRTHKGTINTIQSSKTGQIVSLIR